MEFLANFQIWSWSGPSGVLLNFLIMVLVLVLSGKWSSAQILTMVLVPSGDRYGNIKMIQDII